MATAVLPQDTEWHTVGKGDKKAAKTEYVSQSDPSVAPIPSDNPYEQISSPTRKSTKMSSGSNNQEDITTTTTRTKTTTTYPARATSSSLGGLTSYFGPSSSFRRNQQKWLLGASVLGLSLLVALTAISLSHTIGSTKSAMDFAKDKAQQLSSQGLADVRSTHDTRPFYGPQVNPTWLKQDVETAPHHHHLHTPVTSEDEESMSQSHLHHPQMHRPHIHRRHKHHQQTTTSTSTPSEQSSEFVDNETTPVNATHDLVDIGTTPLPEHFYDDAWDRAQHERLHPNQMDNIGDKAAYLKNQAESWMDHSKHTGKSWWSTWSHWLSGELEHAENLADVGKDQAKEKMAEGNAKARAKLLEPEHEGMFMRAYHYLFSRSEADEAAARARQYANEARDAIRPTVWERMKHALGQSTPEENIKFFAESGIDQAGNIIDKAKFDAWEAAINAKDRMMEKGHEMKEEAKEATEPTLSERVARAFHHEPTAEEQAKEAKETVKEKLEEYYDQAREAAHPTLWARFKNAFGQATPIERAQIFASAGLDESGRIVDKVKFAAYQKALYAKDQAHVYADESKTRLHPSLWARMKHAFGQASPSEIAQIYATAGLDEAGNIVDKARFATWEQAQKLRSASVDAMKDLKARAREATREPTLWERISSSFHHEPTWTERAHDAKEHLDQYYDAARNAAHPTLWARFKNAFGQATPAERAQIYAAAGLDEAGNIIDRVKFAAYEQALKAKDAVNVYADKSQSALHPTAWARLKNVFGQATPAERAQIYASAGLDEAGNIIDKARFAAWDQAVRLKGAAYDAGYSLRRTLYPEPTLYEKFRNLFVSQPSTTERAQDMAARSFYATKDAAQQAYEAAREAVAGHEPTMGERIAGLFRHKPSKTERAKIYAEQLMNQAKDTAQAAKDRLYPEPTLGEKIRHLFVHDDTPAERARYLASAGLDQAGNIIDKAKFNAWEQALKIKAAAHDATHPSVWERTKAVFVEPTPAQKAKLYAGSMMDAPGHAYDKLKHKYAPEPTMMEKIKGYFVHEPTSTEKAKLAAEHAAEYLRWSTPEPTFGERIASAFSGSDLTTAQRVADSLHGAASELRHEPSLTDRIRATVYGAPEPSLTERAREALADTIDNAGHRLHHEPTLAERAQQAAQNIRDSVVGGQPEPSTYQKIKDAVLPHHDEHLKEQEKEHMRKKAHEAIDKNVK